MSVIDSLLIPPIGDLKIAIVENGFRNIDSFECLSRNSRHYHTPTQMSERKSDSRTHMSWNRCRSSTSPVTI